jgi:hypothetical protein
MVVLLHGPASAAVKIRLEIVWSRSSAVWDAQYHPSTFLIFEQTILNLQEPAANPLILEGEIMDEHEELNKLEGKGLKKTERDMNAVRLMLACVYNDWDSSEKTSDVLESYLTGDGFVSRDYHRTLFMALASIVLGRGRICRKKKYRAMGKKVIKQQERKWEWR